MAGHAATPKTRRLTATSHLQAQRLDNSAPEESKTVSWGGLQRTSRPITKRLNRHVPGSFEDTWRGVGAVVSSGTGESEARLRAPRRDPRSERALGMRVTQSAGYRYARFPAETGRFY